MVLRQKKKQDRYHIPMQTWGQGSALFWFSDFVSIGEKIHFKETTFTLKVYDLV